LFTFIIINKQPMMAGQSLKRSLATQKSNFYRMQSITALS